MLNTQTMWKAICNWFACRKEDCPQQFTILGNLLNRTGNKTEWNALVREPDNMANYTLKTCIIFDCGVTELLSMSELPSIDNNKHHLSTDIESLYCGNLTHHEVFPSLLYLNPSKSSAQLASLLSVPELHLNKGRLLKSPSASAATSVLKFCMHYNMKPSTVYRTIARCRSLRATINQKSIQTPLRRMSTQIDVSRRCQNAISLIRKKVKNQKSPPARRGFHKALNQLNPLFETALVTAIQTGFSIHDFLYRDTPISSSSEPVYEACNLTMLPVENYQVFCDRLIGYLDVGSIDDYCLAFGINPSYTNQCSDLGIPPLQLLEPLAYDLRGENVDWNFLLTGEKALPMEESIIRDDIAEALHLSRKSLNVLKANPETPLEIIQLMSTTIMNLKAIDESLVFSSESTSTHKKILVE